MSEGLYGPPPYTSTPPSGGAWGALWNAAGAVTRTLAGAIVSVVGVVWSVEVAADNFLDHLAVEAAALAGEIVARTAATLVSIGKLIASALNALLNWILALVKAALALAVDPIEAGVSAYDLSLDSPLSRAWTSENTSGSVEQASATAFANAFVSGAPFEAALGIGVAVTVALTLLTPFDLGPAILVGTVIGLVAGAALASFGSLSAAAQLSSSAVDAIESLVNPIKSLPSTEWATISGVFGLLAAGEEVPWSWYVLSQALLAKPTGDFYTGAVAVMSLAVLALIIGLIAVASASAILLLVAFVLSCIALFGVSVNYFGSNSPLTDVPSVRLLGEADVGLSASAMLGSMIDVGINEQKLENAL
ncbi:MAG TPA: hypothetical protein VMG81_02130 [Thermoplasmata archaeon]|nr:hypothetical protein [Thermoplasmata archaeon]